MIEIYDADSQIGYVTFDPYDFEYNGTDSAGPDFLAQEPRYSQILGPVSEEPQEYVTPDGNALSGEELELRFARDIQLAIPEVEDVKVVNG